MQFYDNTNKQGLCQEIDRLCDTDDITYTRVAKTSRINVAQEEIAGLLINADGTWQFDDSNYSTLPIGTYTLVEGQQSYTFASDFLDIEEVDILLTSGMYVKLIPIDHNELGDMSIDTWIGNTTSTTVKGLPLYYDKWEDSIKLYPAPSSSGCTLTNGLKVYFKRTSKDFTVASDTSADTTTPGFASPYHVILAYMAALPYCMTYKKDRVGIYAQKIEQLKKELISHYSLRQKDVRNVMTPQSIGYL